MLNGKIDPNKLREIAKVLVKRKTKRGIQNYDFLFDRDDVKFGTDISTIEVMKKGSISDCRFLCHYFYKSTRAGVKDEPIIRLDKYNTNCSSVIYDIRGKELEELEKLLS